MTAFAARDELFAFDQDDAAWLDRWRDAPLTYHPGDEHAPDHHFHIDHHQHRLEFDTTGLLFGAARDLLLRYTFYPRDVMTHASDFARDARHMRPGDRLVQRIRALPGLPLLTVLTMNAITAVTDQPERVGFTYATTAAHREIGQWSAGLTWNQTNGDVVLHIDSIARPGPDIPPSALAYTRWLQQRAHRRGIAHFTRRALAQWQVARDNACFWQPSA